MSEVGELSRLRKKFPVTFSPKADEGLRKRYVTPETLKGKIKGLTEAGFKTPIESIEEFPPLAGLDIQRVTRDLMEAGFKNPAGLIEKFPPLAGLDIQRVTRDLMEAGFKNPAGLIEKFPSLAGLDIQRVKRDLMEAGFKDPVGLIEKRPQISGLNIQRAIKNLTEAGFEDPVGLIEKFPQSAELNIDKIKQKLKLIKDINIQFGANYDPVKIIESYPQYLSYSKSRIFFYLRVASLFPPNEKLYKQLIMNNPFLIFDFLFKAIPNDEIEMRKIVSRCIGLNKKEKDIRIGGVKENLPQILKELKANSENKKTKFLSRLAINLLRQME